MESILEKLAKKTHPVSEAQRRWAFAAEERGQLPKGKAHTWSKRVEGESLPEKTASLFDQIKEAAFVDELQKIAMRMTGARAAENELFHRVSAAGTRAGREASHISSNERWIAHRTRQAEEAERTRMPGWAGQTSSYDRYGQ